MVERNDAPRSLFDVLERVMGQGVTLIRDGLERRAIRLLGVGLVVVQDPDGVSGGGPDPRPSGSRVGG